MENKSKYNSVASLELKAQKGAKDGSINQEKKNKTRKDNNQNAKISKNQKSQSKLTTEVHLNKNYLETGEQRQEVEEAETSIYRKVGAEAEIETETIKQQKSTKSTVISAKIKSCVPKQAPDKEKNKDVEDITENRMAHNSMPNIEQQQQQQKSKKEHIKSASFSGLNNKYQNVIPNQVGNNASNLNSRQPSSNNLRWVGLWGFDHEWEKAKNGTKTQKCPQPSFPSCSSINNLFQNPNMFPMGEESLIFEWNYAKFCGKILDFWFSKIFKEKEEEKKKSNKKNADKNVNTRFSTVQVNHLT